MNVILSTSDLGGRVLHSVIIPALRALLEGHFVWNYFKLMTLNLLQRLCLEVLF
jgi:hypothetical protein